MGRSADVQCDLVTSMTGKVPDAESCIRTWAHSQWLSQQREETEVVAEVQGDQTGLSIKLSQAKVQCKSEAHTKLCWPLCSPSSDALKRRPRPKSMKMPSLSESTDSRI